MKAIAVTPGKPNTVHLRDVPKPALDQVPNGRGVLVKVLRVGVDGTDKEINAAEYGAAPPGDDPPAEEPRQPRQGILGAARHPRGERRLGSFHRCRSLGPDRRAGQTA